MTKTGTTYSWQVRARNAAGLTYADGDSVEMWSFLISAADPYEYRLRLYPPVMIVRPK